MKDELMTTEEVARHYQVAPQTVRRWAASGAPAVKLPGALRFEPEALRGWLLDQSLRETPIGRR